jgi:hypothetical protein
MLVKPGINGPCYANIAEKNKMRNAKNSKAASLRKIYGREARF